MSEVEVESVCDKGLLIKLPRKPKGVRLPSRVVVRFLDAEGTDEAEAARLAAVEQVMADLQEGLDLGGPPYPKREDLYDRVKRYTKGNA